MNIVVSKGIDISPKSEFLELEKEVKNLPAEERKGRLRGYIDWIESQILDCIEQGEPEAPFHTEHFLKEGIYTRTMFVPQGEMITGFVHKKPCMSFMMQGEISVVTENGVTMLTSPSIFPSAKGVRRLGYTHSDTIMSSVFSVEGTTLEEIEEELFQIDYLGDE